MLLPTLAVLAAPLAPADYMPLEEAEAIVVADLAVEGTIVEFSDPSPEDGRPGGALPTLTLQVHEVLFGTLPNGSPPAARLTVVGFRNWTCASRHAPYATGQRAVFFLEFERARNGSVKRDEPARVMGAANEGECPVVEGEVYHQGVGVRQPGQHNEIAGHTYFGISTPREEFVGAVRGLRRCFRVERDAESAWFPGPEHVESTCSAAELQAYVASSRFAASLVVDSEILRLARQ